MQASRPPPTVCCRTARPLHRGPPFRQQRAAIARFSGQPAPKVQSSSAQTVTSPSTHLLCSFGSGPCRPSAIDHGVAVRQRIWPRVLAANLSPSIFARPPSAHPRQDEGLDNQNVRAASRPLSARNRAVWRQTGRGAPGRRCQPQPRMVFCCGFCFLAEPRGAGEPRSAINCCHQRAGGATTPNWDRASFEREPGMTPSPVSPRPEQPGTISWRGRGSTAS